MPRNDTRTTTINEFYKSLNKENDYDGDNIIIASLFQRGNEEDGVWSLNLKRDYIESLINGWPIGPTMLIKPAGSHANPWLVLDGGNRARTIRDFLNNKFKTKGDTLADRKYFRELDETTKANFKANPIYLIEVRITRDDPDDIVSELYTRINTKISPLKDGELIKALGWQNDRTIIELAKKLIGEHWISKIDLDNENDKRIENCRNKFIELFPKPERETKRCDNLAMMIGYIVSSITNNVSKFDKRFNRLKPYLRKDYEFKEEDETKFYNRINTLFNILKKINTQNLIKLIPNTCGMPSRLKIFPIWGLIITDKMTDTLKKKIPIFYNNISDNADLRINYEAELAKNGNSEIGANKLINIKNMIEANIELINENISDNNSSSEEDNNSSDEEDNNSSEEIYNYSSCEEDNNSSSEED